MAEALVASYTGLAEAHVARATLASEGIEARLAGEQLVGVAWHLSNAIGGVRLLVAPEDVERARQVLAVPEEVPAVEDLDEPGPGDALAAKAWKAALLGFIFAPPLLHLWSLWLVAHARPRTDRGRRDARRSLVVSAAVVVAAIAILAVRFL